METMLYSLSFISLIAGIIWLLVEKMLGNRTDADYFRTAKTAVLASIIFTVVFYNKTPFPDYFAATPYAVSFYVVCALTFFVWMSLSFRWFTSLDIPPYNFCNLALCSVLMCKFIITTTDWGILAGALTGLSVVNYAFLRFSQKAEEFHKISTRYGWSITFFVLLTAVGLALLPYDNLSYGSVAEFLIRTERLRACVIVIGPLFLILFMSGIAPLHFWFSDVIAPAVLPVAAYFSFVTFPALWSVFIGINMTALDGYSNELSVFYLTCGVLSVIIGAVGAHTSRNIKKIFGYVGLFSLGVLMIVISPFDKNSLVTGLIYMQTYFLAIVGVYTCFYGFKSSREYLNNLAMINGIATVRPYISAALLFFIFSLVGLAPLPGFTGLAFVIRVLTDTENHILIFLILGGCVVMAAALARIIHAVYFAPRENDYDRPDRSIYLYLSIIATLYAMVVYSPAILLDNVEIVLAQTVK